jgi:catechol 2,3-dioxygenase-like lactoylglutathione lyase family enzyme
VDFKLHHFGIVCEDIEKSLKTYLDQLEQTLTSRWYNRGQLNIAFLGKGSQATMEIVGKPHLEYEEAHIAKHGYSVNHLSFLVDNAELAFRELKGKGVSVAWEPFIMDDILGLCQCAFYDEDGMLFEVFSYPKGKAMSLPDKTTSHHPNDLRLHHISLLTPDLRRAQRFYTEKLGMRTVFEWLEDDGGFVFLVDPTYDLKENDFMLEIIGPPYLEPREEVLLNKRGACFDHIAFIADDLSGAWQDLLKRGAKKVADPVSGYSVGYMAWIADPDGIDVEIMSPIPANIVEEALRSGKAPNLASRKG